MKKLIRTIAVSLAVGLLSTAFVGCGKKVANSETEIEISFWEGSFGVDFMKDIVSAFESKYPEYKVN